MANENKENLLRAIGYIGEATDAKIAAALDGTGPGGDLPQNVVTALPENPLVNTAYFSLEQVTVDPIAGVTYTAGPKDAPAWPPAPIPGGITVSFMGGVGMGFAYDTVSNIFTMINGLTGDAFAVEDGGDIYMGMITIDTDTPIAAWLYFFGQTTINGTTYDGHAALNLDLSIEAGNTAKDFFTGAWTFGQADIDSGAVAAFMEAAGPRGWSYFDGDAWQSLPRQTDTALAARVAALEASLALSQGEVGGAMGV